LRTQNASIGSPPGTTLRKESFGGILFRKDTGKCVELNRGGYDILSMVGNGTNIDEVVGRYAQRTGLVNGRDIERLEDFLHFLRLQGMLVRGGSRPRIIGKNNEISTDDQEVSFNPKLSAPEVVHLSITDSCNLECKSCYLYRGGSDGPSVEKILSILRQCREIGVLQLSFGGGEPLLRARELADCIGFVSEIMRVSVTTNGTMVKDNVAKMLKDAGLSQLQVSLNGPKDIHEKVSGSMDFDRRVRGIECAARNGLFLGVNTILSKSLVGKVDEFLAFLESHGVQHVNFIRPKLSEKNERWYSENAPHKEDFSRLRDIFTGILRRHPGLSMTHDCSLVQLYRDEPPQHLRALGINGCSAWRRMCYITPSLDVYGCSHMIGVDEPEGNLFSRDH
jgi:MoaA/NifB/PqqE/SkfB family radical SAM enzyme